MKKVYETPNVVITAFDTMDSTNVTVFKSVAGPQSKNKVNVKTGTLG